MFQILAETISLISIIHYQQKPKAHSINRNGSIEIRNLESKVISNNKTLNNFIAQKSQEMG
jgi:hypothetical protein